MTFEPLPLRTRARFPAVSQLGAAHLGWPCVASASKAEPAHQTERSHPFCALEAPFGNWLGSYSRVSSQLRGSELSVSCMERHGPPTLTAVGRRGRLASSRRLDVGSAPSQPGRCPSRRRFAPRSRPRQAASPASVPPRPPRPATAGRCRCSWSGRFSRVASRLVPSAVPCGCQCAATLASGLRIAPVRSTVSDRAEIT